MRETLPADDAPEPPLLPPWIGWLKADGRPALFYADSRGQLVRVPLGPLDLARLALSLAEAQTLQARRALPGEA